MRYMYLGDRMTDPRYVGQPCDPIRRADGKCIVGASRGLGPELPSDFWWRGKEPRRGGPRNQLVRFADGAKVAVPARLLRVVHPIVLLDCDGVLNSPNYQIHRHKRRRDADGLPVPPVDPACVAHLNALTDRTGARIVVSSTWRKWGLRRVRRVLRDAGVKAPIVGMTPVLERPIVNGERLHMDRGDEIAEWRVRAGPNVDRFVILDDDADMGVFMDRLVRTDYQVGLTAADVDRAVSLLTEAGQ